MKVKKFPTPLEEALLVLIHLRKQRLKFKEMEIIAISGISKDNQESLQSAMDSYRGLLFPAIGERKPKESFEDRAKKQLAEEVKKAYLVRPAGMDSIEKIAKTGTDEARVVAAKFLKEQPKKIEKAVFRPLPKGVIKG